MRSVPATQPSPLKSTSSNRTDVKHTCESIRQFRSAEDCEACEDFQHIHDFILISVEGFKEEFVLQKPHEFRLGDSEGVAKSYEGSVKAAESLDVDA